MTVTTFYFAAQVFGVYNSVSAGTGKQCLKPNRHSSWNSSLPGAEGGILKTCWLPIASTQ